MPARPSLGFRDLICTPVLELQFITLRVQAPKHDDMKAPTLGSTWDLIPPYFGTWTLYTTQTKKNYPGSLGAIGGLSGLVWVPRLLRAGSYCCIEAWAWTEPLSPNHRPRIRRYPKGRYWLNNSQNHVEGYLRYTMLQPC